MEKKKKVVEVQDGGEEDKKHRLGGRPKESWHEGTCCVSTRERPKQSLDQRQEAQGGRETQEEMAQGNVLRKQKRVA